MTEPVIDIKDVSIGFDGKSGETLHVLRNVDMSVSEGESLGIVGESGSGKSTLALAAMAPRVNVGWGGLAVLDLSEPAQPCIAELRSGARTVARAATGFLRL